MFDSQMDQLMPSIMGHIKGECNKIGYDGYKLDMPCEDMPEALYAHLWEQIRPIVLKWLERNKPMAWFKPMYMTVDEQRKLGLPV